jgi:hypothetical protein
VKINKLLIFVLLTALVISLIACGGASKEDQIAVVVALTQTAAASTPSQPAAAPAAELGHIVGAAHGVAPPTPSMTIYAIEVSTNEWVSVQTAESQGEAAFTLDVKPGTYVVFSSLGLGYPSMDGWSLGLVNVANGETVSGITVAPPSQSDCGVMFGVPASPDGLYPAVPGPTEECMAAVMSGGQQAPAAPSTQPQRIQFAAGATDARLQNRLSPGGLHPYVFGASAGQEMGINLIPSDMGILSIWGADGTILAKEEERVSGWRGIVPTTQDYYIDVISASNSDFDYTLDVYVSALTQGNPATNVFPKAHPFNAAYMQGIFDSGLPAMLPPSFPVGDGLPAVAPYLIFSDSNSYAYDLGYGPDCQGGGACHYGSFTTAANSTGSFIGLNGFPYEAGKAQKVSLDKGITGYFVDSSCGANCSDAMIWWMYNGYQYSLGLQAQRDQVIAMANVAINNSIP